MPEIGEIRSAGTIGDKHRRIWTICPVCKNMRWVILSVTKRIGFTGRCHKCNVSFRGGYRLKKGGRYQTTGKTGGYVYILLQPDDFFYPMTNPDGYVHEHRLVMAKHLGRLLHSWEIVHHKNHIRNDNRLENLELLSDIGHKQLSRFDQEIAHLRLEIKRLKDEIRILKEGKKP